MKTIFHLIAKDLRLLRWYLAAWVALFLVTEWVATVAFLPADIPPENVLHWRPDFLLAGVTYALWGLRFIVGFLLLGRLVQADDPVAANAFWATRPISRAHLAAAKTLAAIAAAVVLPVAIALPWWWWHGLEGLPLLQTVGLKVAGQLALVLVALPAAVLSTGGFSQIIIGAGTVVGGFMALGLGEYFVRKVASVKTSPTYSIELFLIVAVATYLVVHFLRSRRWGTAVLLCGLGLACVPGVVCRIEPRPIAPPALEPEGMRSLEFRLATPVVRSGNLLRWRAEVHGLPQGHALGWVKVDSRWTFADDFNATSVQTWSTVLGDENGRRESDLRIELQRADNKTWDATKAESGTVAATVSGEIWEHGATQAVLPVVVGATVRGDNCWLRVAGLGWQGRNLCVILAESTPMALRFRAIGGPPLGWRPASYLLINPANGRSVGSLNLEGSDAGREWVVDGVQLRGARLDFLLDDAFLGERTADLDAVLASCEIRRVSCRRLGNFCREIPVTEFRVKDGS